RAMITSISSSESPNSFRTDRTVRPLNNAATTASSRSSGKSNSRCSIASVMLGPPALHCAHCITKPRRDPGLDHSKLTDQARIVHATPARMPRRDRREQPRRGPQLAPELRGANQRGVQDVLRAIRQPGALSAPQGRPPVALYDEKEATSPVAARRAPVSLRPAVRPALALDLDHLLDPIDDQRQA